MLEISNTTKLVLAFLVWAGYAIWQFRYFVGMLRAIGRESGQFRRLLTASEEVAWPLEHPWFAWLRSMFPAGHAVGGQLTRDDALQEFDRGLGSNASYMFLQRLGFGAPLLGVGVTAIGFWLFKPPENVERLSNIWSAITPLILGVFLGASLALLNQLLLAILDARIESLRSLVRNWFDEAVWKKAVLQTTTQLLKQVAESLSETSRQQTEGTRTMQNVAVMMEKTAAAFETSLSAFVKELHGMPQNLPRLGELVNEAVGGFQQVLPQLNEASHVFGGSVEVYRKTTEDTLSRVALHQQTAAADLADVSRGLYNAMSTLQANAGSMTPAVDAMQVSAQAVRSSLEDCLLPQQTFVREAVGRIDVASRDLTDSLMKLQCAIDRAVGQAGEAGENYGAFATATNRFHDLVEQELAPAASQFHVTAGAISTVIGRATQASLQLEQSSIRLASASTDQSEASAQMKLSVHHLLLPAHELLQRAAKRFDSTAEELHEYLDRLRREMLSAGQGLAEMTATVRPSLEGMLPAFDRFGAAIENHFEPSVKQHADIASGLAATATRLAGTFASVDESVKALADALKENSATQQAALSNIQLVATAIQEFHVGAGAFRAGIVDQAVPAQRAVQETMEAMRRSAIELSEFVREGIAPAVEQLRELPELLDSIRLALDSLRPLTVDGQESARLIDALNQLTHTSVSLSQLSEQIQYTVKSNGNGATVDSPPKRRWFRWPPWKHKDVP